MTLAELREWMLKDELEKFQAELERREREAYARGWNDCSDAFKLGARIVPDRSPEEP